MATLEVKGLRKVYPGFTLQDISFSVEPGTVMGLIGRNGAGKTTTLKALLNLIRTDGGEIRYFGLPLQAHEQEIKQRIGYACGAVDYYPRRKIADLLAVTRRFYPQWDDALCSRYLRAFSIDPEKTPRELSEGMRVKLNLVPALSHHAELLLLDEPTSGLDPVSRAELLDVFAFLREQGVAILYSTHITSDLEKCADAITYLHQGSLRASAPMAEFLAAQAAAGFGATLEEIMVNREKEDLHETFGA
ncbi:MAG: ABC transporter ATP-binding protein [Clostridia bacterium]|nr:ABC transporter ATP-binding protein [Clostridia bacterium]